MMKNKANGPAECLVTKMLQCLSMETVYEVAHWFEKRFKGECRVPKAWTLVRRVFSKARCPIRKRATWTPCDCNP